MIFRFIREHTDKFSVERMCRLFNVSRSGYYQWLYRGPSARSKRDEVLKKKIREFYHEGRGLYGSSRIHRRLLKKGYRCGKKRVERLMKEMGIRARHKRKYKATTVKSQLSGGENLQRNFAMVPISMGVRHNISTPGRVALLSTIMDLYSRRIVG